MSFGSPMPNHQRGGATAGIGQPRDTPAPAATPAKKKKAAPAAAASPVPKAPAPPNLGNWDITKETDPEMARSRQRAEDYLSNLEQGAGYAMDVYQGSAQAQIDADVARARESAQAQGIPFNEDAYRRDANQKMQAGLAQEKLGRETLYGQMQAGLQGNIAGEGERALAKSGLELQRQGTRAGALNQQYGTQAGIYGTEVGRQIAEMQDQTNRYQAAMDALMNFFKMSFDV